MFGGGGGGGVAIAREDPRGRGEAIVSHRSLGSNGQSGDGEPSSALTAHQTEVVALRPRRTAERAYRPAAEAHRPPSAGPPRKRLARAPAHRGAGAGRGAP